MKLIQINKGYKCPNCKRFGLKPMKRYYRINGYYHAVCVEEEGHFSVDELSNDSISNKSNFYRCLSCFAEFKEEE